MSKIKDKLQDDLENPDEFEVCESMERAAVAELESRVELSSDRSRPGLSSDRDLVPDCLFNGFAGGWI